MGQEKLTEPIIVKRVVSWMYVSGNLPAIETMNDRQEYKCNYVQSIKPTTWQQGDHEVHFTDATISQALEELRAISKMMAA